MYTIDDLNVRLLSELKEIAEDMGVKNAKKLPKQDLIYKILDQQAVAGETAAAAKPVIASAPVTSDGEPERKMRPRRRENVAPTPPPAPPTPKPETDFSSDEILDSIDINFESTPPTFNTTENESETS